MNGFNKGSLKALGVVMIIFALVYALVGTLALAGVVTGVLPGHQTQEIMVVVLAYVVAVLALVCGIVCIGCNRAAAKVFGLIFAVAGLASLIYQQMASGAFSIFDCLAMCFGIAIFYIAAQVEE